MQIPFVYHYVEQISDNSLYSFKVLKACHVFFIGRRELPHIGREDSGEKNWRKLENVFHEGGKYNVLGAVRTLFMKDFIYDICLGGFPNNYYYHSVIRIRSLRLKASHWCQVTITMKLDRNSSCTRITLSILQSFLNFLKVKKIYYK